MDSDYIYTRYEAGFNWKTGMENIKDPLHVQCLHRDSFPKNFQTEAGLDARKVGNRIQEQDVKDRLKATTDEAVARGVFGAPTSFVGDMMFFGNDRLPFVEMALKGDLK